MSINQKLRQITTSIANRSQQSRDVYLEKIQAATQQKPSRTNLACGNMAHTMAACSSQDKKTIAANIAPNLAIVTAYNDMLSAHKPYETYPQIIRDTAKKYGATSQVAGGVPAMCDGITQGQAGMELSLFSRDVIAMSTSIALSHQVFDGVLCLGICDKIVPGLLIGALSFGHLPLAFIPAGPMGSGISNKEKAISRQKFAEGEISKSDLLEVESASYHSPGTCTFYGTANSNQMLMEIMGLQLPGSSFIPPASALREQLTIAAVENQLQQLLKKKPLKTLAQIVTVETIVNGMVGLLATGGSTNLTIHLIAIARAAGIIINWQDMSALSQIVPLLCRIYPNGEADINHFQAAGGMGFLIKQLLAGGLLHQQVQTILGDDLSHYLLEPVLEKNPQAEIFREKTSVITSKFNLNWRETNNKSKDENVLRPITRPFSDEGGLKLLQGNLGRSIIKISAVKEEFRVIQAKAKVFNSQHEFRQRYATGELNTDFIAVIRFQGPASNGMPELHHLMPIMGALQDKGFQVAIVTDGRMSGASGKVPSAIHMVPEAKNGGAIVKIIEGDLIKLDANNSTLEVIVDELTLDNRKPAESDYKENVVGMGRELFTSFRTQISSAENGASVFEY